MKQSHTKAYLSVAFLAIVWGTTFLAIRVGVRYYPAFFFAGTRQFIAGILLVAFALLRDNRKDLSLKNISRQMLVGFLMLSLGNGFVTWGEKYVPSGIAALICSMMPIFAVLLNLVSSKKEHFNLMIGAGLLLGFCGVALIFRNNIADLANPSYLIGICCIIFSTCSWAFGSIVNKKFNSKVNPMFNSGLQLFFGGIFMLIGSPLIDDFHNVTLWHPSGLAALLYLIIFGSVIAYAAYMYALSKLPVGIATIYAYINPLVAVILGYLILGEPLNMYTALAFITIVAGVYLVNRGHKKGPAVIKQKELQKELKDIVVHTP